MNQVFTCGYSGHTVAQLKKAVEQHNARVLDIRLSPRSRMPEWNGEALSKELGKRYLPFPILGNLNYKTGGPIQIRNGKNGCDIIVKNLLPSHSLILLCGCRDYDSCHRAVVAQMLHALNIPTEELV